MIIQTVIRKGQAYVTPNGLRCQGPRLKEPSQRCGKLIAKRSESGQIAGCFKCDRCGAVTEIEMVLPR